MKMNNLLIPIILFTLASCSSIIKTGSTAQSADRKIASTETIQPRILLKGNDILKYKKIVISLKYSNQQPQIEIFNPASPQFDITKDRLPSGFSIDKELSEKEQNIYQYKIQAILKDDAFPNIIDENYRSFETEWIKSSKSELQFTSADWNGPRKVKFNIEIKKDNNIKLKYAMIRLSWKNKKYYISSKGFRTKKPRVIKGEIITDNHDKKMTFKITYRAKVENKKGKKKYIKRKFDKKFDTTKTFTIKL